MNRESKAFKSFSSALETLFLALTGLYLVYRISKSTMFQLKWPAHFEEIMMWTMGAVAVARLVSAGAIRKKTLAGVAIAAVYGLVYRNDGYSFLVFLAIFTVGFIDMDYRKILKLYLLTAGSVYGITLIAGMLGVITNFVTARAGRGIRSAWGMSYYTDFASLGLFLLMTLWVALKKLPGWAMVSLCAGYLFLAARIAHSNTSTICACLLIVAMLYSAFERRVVDRRKDLRWMRKGPEWFATFGFPLLALIMFIMMLLYARGLNVGYRLNVLLSKRLYYSVKAWKAYGVRSFGTPFQQNGGGFSTLHSNGYNFVDSTYPLVLLRYGWALFALLCLSWGWTARKAIACRDRRLLLVMGIILIHAFSEHHFLDSHFNILVTMPLALYPTLRDERAHERAPANRRAALAWLVTALLLVLAAWLAGPALLSRIKTVLQYMHLGNGEHGLRLFCALGLLLFGIAIAAWALSRTLLALLDRERLAGLKRPLAVLAACAVAGGGLWLVSGRVVDAAVEQNRPMIEADREALEIAVKTSAGRVIPGVLPSAYSRAIGGLSQAAFFEDDLARLHGATVLLPVDTERAPFMDSGFLYVPISEAHALYTGDRAVVEALTGAGYHATGYYSSVQSVDLAEAARVNELEYDEQSGLRLTSGSTGMAYGPWQDLYGGRYTVNWRLKLPQGVKRSGKKRCTLRVTADKGETVLLEKKVRLSRFDENGELSIDVPISLKDSRNVGFDATVAAGMSVDVQQISFVRAPAYDVHTYYDASLRKTREEYYDLDGSRKLRQRRWFARDFAYDRYGYLEQIRYYDRDGKPVVIDQGYAVLRRDHDARGKIVREAYLGVNDEPVIAANGYAAEERDYDAAGNVVARRYYGVDGKPLANTKGYAEVRRQYDGQRNVIREAYFGIDGAPVLCEGGFAAFERDYDGEGRVVAQRYYGVDGEPILIKSGYASMERVYDKNGNLVKKRYYDLSGQPVKRTGKR